MSRSHQNKSGKSAKWSLHFLLFGATAKATAYALVKTTAKKAKKEFVLGVWTVNPIDIQAQRCMFIWLFGYSFTF